MADLAGRFDVEVGLSDHTLGTTVPVAAVALGATVIEKHFTLSRKDEGPDSTFSLEPAEFREMVDAVRIVEQALGEVQYERSEKEQASVVFRRSLYAIKDIGKGETITHDNVRSIRPGYGLKPKFLKSLIGKNAACQIERGTAITADLVDGLEG